MSPTIIPQVGYLAINELVEYLNQLDPSELSIELMEDYSDFSDYPIVEAALMTAISGWRDVDEKGQQLVNMGWLLPNRITRKKWFADIRDEGACDLDKHADEIEVVWEAVCCAIANSACHMLFNDVPALYYIHQKLAEGNRQQGYRCARCYIPSWVKRAVYHRDRSVCHWCEKYVGAYDAQTQFDHMIPLAQFGVNDVTNIVLSCGHCNRKKAGKMKPVRLQRKNW